MRRPSSDRGSFGTATSKWFTSSHVGSIANISTPPTRAAAPAPITTRLRVTSGSLTETTHRTILLARAHWTIPHKHAIARAMFRKTLQATHPDMMRGALNAALAERYVVTELFRPEAVS